MCGLSLLICSQVAETSAPSPPDVIAVFVNSTPTVSESGRVKSSFRSPP
jgi:hypothetical protein